MVRKLVCRLIGHRYDRWRLLRQEFDFDRICCLRCGRCLSAVEALSA